MAVPVPVSFNAAPSTRSRSLFLYDALLNVTIDQHVAAAEARSISMAVLEPFEAWRPTVSVFIPYFDKDGKLESPEYDLPAFRDELNGWFTALGYEWHWVPVTLNNLRSTIERLEPARLANQCLVMNLCDGNEVDGSPGVSVVRALEDAAIPYTGSSPYFYDVTTYKVALKTRLREHGVPTAPFVALRHLPADVDRLDAEVGYPAFVKPEVSAGEAPRRLIGGTARFPTVQKDLRANLARAQKSFPTVIGCSDSRGPPELLFDANCGERSSSGSPATFSRPRSPARCSTREST